jgi:hypothetical protein
LLDPLKGLCHGASPVGSRLAAAVSYRAAWSLPGPDFHRLVSVILREHPFPPIHLLPRVARYWARPKRGHLIFLMSVISTAEGIHVGLSMANVATVLGAPHHVGEDLIIRTPPFTSTDRKLVYPGLVVWVEQIAQDSPIKKTEEFRVKEIEVVPLSPPNRHV